MTNLTINFKVTIHPIITVNATNHKTMLCTCTMLYEDNKLLLIINSKRNIKIIFVFLVIVFLMNAGLCC